MPQARHRRREYGPYDPAARDGREVAAGILHSSVLVRWPQDGSWRSHATGHVIASDAYVRDAVLPYKQALHPGGGYLDDAAKRTLKEPGFGFQSTHRPNGLEALAIAAGAKSPVTVCGVPTARTLRV